MLYNAKLKYILFQKNGIYIPFLLCFRSGKLSLTHITCSSSLIIYIYMDEFDITC